MIINDVHQGIKKRKHRKRVGRGPGSGHGKTAGRGEKGHTSRSGFSFRLGFEGGQMPMMRRIAKRGFSNNYFADRVAVLNAGRLEQVAPPLEVYASPATAFVAAFVGVVNRLAAAPDGPGRVRVLGESAELDGEPGTDTVIVRPEALTVGDEGPGEPGTVVTRTFLGAVTRFVDATDGGEITVDAVTRPGLADAGDRTVVRPDTDRVRAAIG